MPPNSSSCGSTRFVLLHLLATCVIASFGVSAADPIKVLNMLQGIPTVADEVPLYNMVNRAIQVGVMAAFGGINFTTAAGREIVLLPIPTTLGTSATTVVQNTLADPSTEDVLAILGPAGDAALLGIQATSLLADNHLVCVAPYTGSMEVRGWSTNTYFTFTDPSAHLLNMLRYIVGGMACRQIGIVRVLGSTYGELELRELQQQLALLGLNPPIVLLTSSTDPQQGAAVEAFLAQLPQAIIMLCYPDPAMAALLRVLLPDARTVGVPFFSAAVSEFLAVYVYSQLVSAGAAVLEDNKMVFTSGFSGPFSTSAAFVRHFQKEIIEYLSEHPTATNLYDPALGDSMLLGWSSAQLLIKTLNQDAWVADRATYQAGLFLQNRYLIEGDLVLGNYGGSCGASAQANGATCFCNTGGRASHLRFLRQDLNITVNGNFTIRFSVGNCAAESSTQVLQRWVSAVALLDNSVRVASYVNDAIVYAMQSGELVSRTTSMDLTVHAVATTSSTYQVVLDHQIANYITDVLVGYVPQSLLAPPNVLVLDPVRNLPVLDDDATGTIFMMPTLRQQLFFVAAFLASEEGGRAPLTAIIRTESDAAAITTALKASVETFELDLRKEMILAETEQLDVRGSSVPTGGVIFFAGATGRTAERDLTFFLERLDEDEELRVVLAWDDAASYEPALREVFSSASQTLLQRIFFITSLPHWAQVPSSIDLVNEYHAALPDSSRWSARSLQGFVVEQLLFHLLAYASNHDANTLRQTIYGTRQFSISGVSMGPYVDCGETELESVCSARNFGATNLELWSFSRLADPVKYAATFGPLTPSMTYVERSSNKKLSKGAIAGICVAVVMVLLLVGLFLFLVCVCCLRSTKNAANAPKDVKTPVTLIFSDVEASSSMWSSIPNAMPSAIAAHERIMRELIIKYGCYEVKTVGDLFMIASKDPYKAVLFARDLQQRLLNHDWRTTTIDEYYLRSEEDMAELDPDYQLTTSKLESAAYSERWSGLRIKMGIHTGLSDIRIDDATHGFDYYGDTSNTAARTAAITHGGQVVLTANTWYALSEQERGTLTSNRLGPHRLRGVARPLNMFELTAVEGRTFAPLQVELALDVDEEDDSEVAHDDIFQGDEMLRGPAEIIYAVLLSTYQPCTPMQKTAAAQQMLRRWKARTPNQPKNMSNMDYSHALMRHLAMSIANTLDPSQALHLFTGDHHRRSLSARPTSEMNSIVADPPLFGGAAGTRPSTRDTRRGTTIHNDSSMPKLPSMTMDTFLFKAQAAGITSTQYGQTTSLTNDGTRSLHSEPRSPSPSIAHVEVIM